MIPVWALAALTAAATALLSFAAVAVLLSFTTSGHWGPGETAVAIAVTIIATVATVLVILGSVLRYRDRRTR